MWEYESACVFYTRAFGDLQPWNIHWINQVSLWEWHKCKIKDQRCQNGKKTNYWIIKKSNLMH